MKDLFNEYLICRERGHVWDFKKQVPQELRREGVIKNVCKYCGTIFCEEKIIREERIPAPPKKETTRA